MSSLTTCIKKAGSLLHPSDKAAILRKAATYRAEGLGNKDAALRAIEETLADVRAKMAAGPKEQPSFATNAYTSSRGPVRFKLTDVTKVDKVVEAVQDRYNRWKDAIEQIRKQGGTISEANDFYRAEERYWGKVGKTIEDFHREVEQFSEQLAADKLTPYDVQEYAYALHAKERNEYIRNQRPGMDAGSGMSDDEAQAIIDTAQQSGMLPQLQRAADTLRRWSDETRDMMLREGLITPEEHAAWSAQYSNYVPLRGLKDENNQDRVTGGTGTAKGFNIRGDEVQLARGRYSQADHIIEQIIQDRTRTAIRAGKNEVMRSFLSFVLDNPSNNLWEVNKVVSKPVSSIDALGNRVLHEEKQVNKDDLTVSVKDGGHEIYITVHDKALREQMQNLHVEQLNQLFAGMHWVNRGMARMYTSMSPVFLVLNGTRDVQAATINMIGSLGFRGAGKMLGNLAPALWESVKAEATGKPSAQYQLFRATGGKTGFFDFKSIDDQVDELNNLMKQSEQGPVDPRKLGRQFLHFVEGANAAVENMTRFAAFQAALSEGKTVAEAASIAKNSTVNFNRKGTLTPQLGAWFLFFNPAVQGSARIVEALKSPKVMATLASAMVGMFGLALLNASMGDDDDGVAWWDKIPAETKERNIIIMLPPTSTKGEKVPGSKTGRYLKIPMPYGYNFFAVMAMQMADVYRNSMDPKRGRPLTEGSMKALSAFLNAWSPVDEFSRAAEGNTKGLVLAATPDALDPIIQPLINLNSFGRPMYPEGFGQDNVPDSQKYFPGQAGTMFQRAADAANKASGGDKYTAGWADLTPAQVENLVRSYGGGPASFVVDIMNAVYVRQAIRRPDLDVARLPFAKQLYARIDAETDRAVAYERMDKIAEAVEPFKKASKDVDAEAVKRLREKYGPIIDLGNELEITKKQLTKMRKDELEIVRSEKLTEEQKYLRLTMLNEQKRRVLQGLNKAYDRSLTAGAK